MKHPSTRADRAEHLLRTTDLSQSEIGRRTDLSRQRVHQIQVARGVVRPLACVAEFRLAARALVAAGVASPEADLARAVLALPAGASASR